MKKSFDAQPNLERAALEKTLRSVVRSEIVKAHGELFSLNQVAEFLQVKRGTVTRLLREEGLPVRYVSKRKPMVLRSELLAWLQTRSPLAEHEDQEVSGSNAPNESVPASR